MDERMPIEVGINAIKQAIVKYVSALCAQYEIPPVIAIQILQEVVYENRISAMSAAISQMQAELNPPQEIDISANDLVDSLSEE